MNRTFRLSLQGIILRTRLGESSSERLFPRTVILDLQWEGSADPGNPSVDYAVLCDMLEPLSHREFSYIEELAAAVLELLESGWQGTWTVTVSKTCPPTSLSMDRAVCTMEGDGL